MNSRTDDALFDAASLSWSEFELRCQKPDHRVIGNWMARRVTRPAALRVTWIVAPWGVSATMTTLAAWLCACLAAMTFGWGTAWGWLIGAALLQAWYLLDHVDGQLARWHGSASLDGVQLDYLMHHTVNLLIPWGVGWGLFSARQQSAWLLVGMAWGLGSLLIGLQNDARYKAFVQRLKRVRGELRVIGGGGSRATASTPVPAKLSSRIVWLARKLCEPHIVMNTLTALAIGQVLVSDSTLIAGTAYAAVLATLSVSIAVGSLARSQSRGSAEREFAAWYQPPQDCDLVFEQGWWYVQPQSRLDPDRPIPILCGHLQLREEFAARDASPCSGPEL